MRKLSLLVLLVPAALAADVVYLKGGGKFTGRITEQTADRIFIDTGDGAIGFGTDRVERIEKGPAPLDEFDARAAKLDPKDVDGWRNLGQWAATKGLSVQSSAAYKRVVALAPDDAEAREALGFVKVDGRWLTEEESYRARGYVKYEGEWLSPSELSAAQAAAAQSQARDDAARRASDAEYTASMDRIRAKEEKSAQQSKEFTDFRASNPIYWGGWGAGVSTWPNSGSASSTSGGAK